MSGGQIVEDMIAEAHGDVLGQTTIIKRQKEEVTFRSEHAGTLRVGSQFFMLTTDKHGEPDVARYTIIKIRHSWSSTNVMAKKLDVKDPNNVNNVHRFKPYQINKGAYKSASELLNAVAEDEFKDAVYYLNVSRNHEKKANKLKKLAKSWKKVERR